MTSQPKPPPTAEQKDSAILRESSNSLRTLVQEAALRIRQSRDGGPVQRLLRGLRVGNGQRYQSSRY